MKLVKEWRKVLRNAWSIKLALASAALTAAELALPYLTDVIPKNVFGILAFVVGVAAAVARVVSQTTVSGTANDTGER